VPFDPSPELTWTDHLPLRHFLPPGVRFLVDAVSPFVPGSGIEMEYRAAMEKGRLTVSGASKRKDASGEPLVRTRAVLAEGAGIESVEMTVRGRKRVVRRVDAVSERSEP
jgi:hypothetical protein